MEFCWKKKDALPLLRFSMLRYILQNQDPDNFSQGSPNESKTISSPESPDRYFFDKGVKMESVYHFIRQGGTNPMHILHFSLEFTIQSFKVNF